MKVIIKHALFYTVMMFLIGATGHFAQAESYLYWTDTKSSVRVSRSTFHGTLTEGVVLRQHNHRVGFMAADHGSGKIYWTGTFTQ